MSYSSTILAAIFQISDVLHSQTYILLTTGSRCIITCKLSEKSLGNLNVHMTHLTIPLVECRYRYRQISLKIECLYDIVLIRLCIKKLKRESDHNQSPGVWIRHSRETKKLIRKSNHNESSDVWVLHSRETRSWDQTEMVFQKYFNIAAMLAGWHQISCLVFIFYLSALCTKLLC